VPDQRFPLSSLRTVHNRKSPTIITIASSAAAFAALLSGISAGGPAHPHGISAGGPAHPQGGAAGGQAASAVTSPDQAGASALTLPAAGTTSPLISRASATGGTAVLTAYTTVTRYRTPRGIARWMMHRKFHWRPRAQFRYLNRLWRRESGWNRYAHNPYSGAYGIPQAVPGRKMSSAGPHWRRNPWTQIRWGLRYIRGRYGTPHAAWRHERNDGWY
jgi:hypothetical protein